LYVCLLSILHSFCLTTATPADPFAAIHADCIGSSLQEYEDTANRILFFSEAFVEADEEDDDKESSKEGSSESPSTMPPLGQDTVTHANNDSQVGNRSHDDSGLDELQKVK
jgi:hypothetical protein